MTRQEELVWAAAWALNLRDSRGGADAPYRGMIASERAAEAVEMMRKRSQHVATLASDDTADVLLRQMAGEPDCFVRERPAPQPGGVYVMCQAPQVAAAAHCQRCAAFGGWPGYRPSCFLEDPIEDAEQPIVPDCIGYADPGANCRGCVRRVP